MKTETAESTKSLNNAEASATQFWDGLSAKVRGKKAAKAPKIGDGPVAEAVAAAHFTPEALSASTPTSVRLSAPRNIDEANGLYRLADPEKSRAGLTAEFCALAVAFGPEFERADVLYASFIYFGGKGLRDDAAEVTEKAIRIKIADCVYFKVWAPV